jgi:fibronectin type 3 domain-containing protein
VTTTASGQIQLQWTFEESATSYQIYRSTTPGGEGATPLATVTSSSYTDSAVTSGVTYYYEITALTGATASARSTEYSANTSGTGTAPPTPAGLVANGGNASVALTWTASAGATSYSIYRGTAPGAEGATPVGTATSNSFTDTGLTNGTTYYYTITASNAAGTSAKSAEVHATPAASGTGTLLSQGQPATASSVQAAGYPASNAVDGNLSTRWSSAFSDPQWLQVDLGATHTISQVTIYWESAYATAFQIQTSNDGTTWTTIYSTTTSTGGTQAIPVSGSGRYVRMYGTKRATGYGYSIWEFQVYGT